MVKKSPLVIPLDEFKKVKHPSGFTLYSKKEIQFDGMVLSQVANKNKFLKELGPSQVMFGWQSMSNPRFLLSFKISPGRMEYCGKLDDKTNFKEDYKNYSLISVNDQIKTQLHQLKKNTIVSIQGNLVYAAKGKSFIENSKKEKAVFLYISKLLIK